MVCPKPLVTSSRRLVLSPAAICAACASRLCQLNFSLHKLFCAHVNRNPVNNNTTNVWLSAALCRAGRHHKADSESRSGGRPPDVEGTDGAFITPACPPINHASSHCPYNLLGKHAALAQSVLMVRATGPRSRPHLGRRFRAKRNWGCYSCSAPPVPSEGPTTPPWLE